MDFQHAYRYDSKQTGIGVPVSIAASGLAVRFRACRYRGIGVPF
jgi:hypothetical protein